MEPQAFPTHWDMMGLSFRAHPWHGVDPGPAAPQKLTVYIEIVPTDTVKYELDKVTGLLCVDRPQRYSNVCPALYGFVPRTYCGERGAALCMERTGRTGLSGDGDPLDICVLTEKSIPRGDILVQAIPIGGLRMLDGNEVDEKIIAVLADDAVYGEAREIDQLSPLLIDRLTHYFLTYKGSPRHAPVVEITEVYGREDAYQVIEKAREDYMALLPGLHPALHGSGARKHA